MRFPYPILLADVGGTNVRFAIVETPKASPVISPSRTTAGYATLARAIRAALKDLSARPRSMLVCAAGPVAGRRVQLTNASWKVDGPNLARSFDLEQGVLLNDFEAQAYSIPSLKRSWLTPVGPAIAHKKGPTLIHGPGTGLGTAALVEVDGRWLAIASEASHSDFAPVTSQEHALWPHVERANGRLTPETLISGPGLRRLHRALALSRGEAAPEIESPAIIERACRNHHSPEAETVRAFWRLVARFSGDLALAFVATGGVILAGGILPRILGLLDPDEFRAIFENKAPYTALAKRIPVSVLTANNSVLAGLAEIAGKPEQFAIDYRTRAWRTVAARSRGMRGRRLR